MVHQRRWSEDDLTRESAEYVAGVIGSQGPTIRRWRKENQTFPAPASDGKLTIARVVMWWLWKKAPKDIARWMLDRLRERFGEQSPATGSEQQASSAEPRKEIDEFTAQKQLLDLRLKSHSVDRQLGDAISAKELTAWLQELANDIRKVLEDIQKTTGIQIRDRMSELFDRKIAEMEAMVSQDGGSRDLD